MESIRCCYVGTIAEFLNEVEDQWLDKMVTNFKSLYEKFPFNEKDYEDYKKPENAGQKPNGQVGAWVDCFRVLQKILKDVECPNTNYIIFEYKIPYEGGRRPDVLIVSSDKLLVLEFKQWEHYEKSHVDQLLGYARDLREYHVATRKRTVIPVLVLTTATEISMRVKGAWVRSPDKFQIHCHSNQDFDIEQWLESDYQPSLGMLTAARCLAKNKPLPEIRQALSAGIPEAMKALDHLVHLAYEQKKFILAFVTGVPGAGKTLLGLQLVYDETEFPTLLVSGNDPLVDVLQYMLENKCLVSRVRNLMFEKRINKNVVVFDEGQRAWSKEPQNFIDYMSNCLEWGFLLVLVGEGQSINTGEGETLVPWKDALKLGWEVACPSKLNNIFCNAKFIEDKLDLTVSLRSHTAGYVSTFVNALVSGNLAKAKDLLRKIDSDDFSIYVTRDLDKAKRYCIDRYENEPYKHYGMITSAKGSFFRLPEIRSMSRANGKNECGPWYVLDRGEKGSGKNLKKVATEFACQGLELDMPIVCWNSDVLWKNDWKTLDDGDETKRNYRINTYRVLLTRGRDGMVIYIPDDRRFNATYEVLREVGIEEL